MNNQVLTTCGIDVAVQETSHQFPKFFYMWQSRRACSPYVSAAPGAHRGISGDSSASIRVLTGSGTLYPMNSRNCRMIPQAVLCEPDHSMECLGFVLRVRGQDTLLHVAAGHGLPSCECNSDRPRDRELAVRRWHNVVRIASSKGGQGSARRRRIRFRDLTQGQPCSPFLNDCLQFGHSFMPDTVFAPSFHAKNP